MEHFYILVTDMDREPDMGPPPSAHSSSSSRHLPSRSPSSNTRSSRSQPASSAPSNGHSIFSTPTLSELMNPPSGAGFGGSSRAESGASAAFSSIFSSVAGPGMTLSGSGGMPPLLPMSATRIFSSFPLVPPEGHSGGEAGSAQSSSGTARAGRTAGTGTPESRGSLSVNPLLEEILQRTFSHISAETFISEFVRRTIDNQRRGNPPASQFAIDNLQEIPAEGSEECCTVCQDEIEDGTQKLRMPCAHSFHRQCLLRWLAEHNTCPVCRCEIESHCARYNQANFDKLKGKLHCKTMSNHEDPSMLEPAPAPDFLFGGAAGAALGAPSAASRTLRMTLRMPVGTLSWLGTEMPSSMDQRRVAPSSGAPPAGAAAPQLARRSHLARGRPREAAPSERSRSSRAAAAAAEPSAPSVAAAGQAAAPSSSEAAPRPPQPGRRPGPSWSVLRPFVAALEEAERGLMEREREAEAGQAREPQRDARPRNPPLPSPGRAGEGRKRRRGGDSEIAGGSAAPAQERDAEGDDEGDSTPVAARTRQRQR